MEKVYEVEETTEDCFGKVGCADRSIENCADSTSNTIRPDALSSRALCYLFFGGTHEA